MIDTAVNLQLNLDAVVRQVSAGVRNAFKDAGARHVEAVTRRFVAFGGGDPIQTRSGALKRSLGFEMRGSGLDLEMRLFSAGAPYARAQEYGGTITPKNKKYLTIPLPDALTGAGVLKGGAKLVKRGSKYETADGAPTFIFKSKAGNLLIGSRAKNNSLRLLYTLKSSVTLKPRLGFRETFDSMTVPFLEQRLISEASKL